MGAPVTPPATGAVPGAVPKVPKAVPKVPKVPTAGAGAGAAAPIGVAIGATGPVCQVAVLGHSKCQYSVKQFDELELLRAVGGTDNVPSIIMCDQVDDPRCAAATAFPTFLTCDAAQSSMPGFRQGGDLLAILALGADA
jgi:hypothetical protein